MGLAHCQCECVGVCVCETAGALFYNFEESCFGLTQEKKKFLILTEQSLMF